MQSRLLRYRLNLHPAKWKHIRRRVLHNKDVVASGAVKARGFEGGDGRGLNREASLTGGANDHDVGRWSLEAYRIRGSLPVALRTNRLHKRRLWKHA